MYKKPGDGRALRIAAGEGGSTGPVQGGLRWPLWAHRACTSAAGRRRVPSAPGPALQTRRAPCTCYRSKPRAGHVFAGYWLVRGYLKTNPQHRLSSLLCCCCPPWRAKGDGLPQKDAAACGGGGGGAGSDGSESDDCFDECGRPWRERAGADEKAAARALA